MAPEAQEVEKRNLSNCPNWKFLGVGPHMCLGACHKVSVARCLGPAIMCLEALFNGLGGMSEGVWDPLIRCLGPIMK
jgi:hypothetical protein